MDEYRSATPASMPDHSMKDYQDSSSMPNLIQGMEDEDGGDVTMSDVGEGFYNNKESSSR